MGLIASFLLSFSLFAAAPQVEPVVILGGGVGAMTSALYLARGEVHATVVEGDLPGGLLTQSHSVQNWPGELEITGSELTGKIRRQAEASGAKFIAGKVIRVDFSKKPFAITIATLTGEEKILYTDHCIIAMGTTPNYLEVKGEKEFWGRGVSNCAICDGSLYRDRIVGVVGGGDAAVLEVSYLSNIAKEVHLFVRKEKLKAIEETRVQEILSKPNVKIHYETTVEEILGKEGLVTQVRLKGGQIVPLDGLFLAIGSKPNSALFQGSLALDRSGYILVDKANRTSLSGVFAVGDIVDPIYKQAVTAAGDGAKAALEVLKESGSHKFLAAKKEEVASIDATVVEITDLAHFNQEIKDSDTMILVDFYATWCPPCKRISPLLDQSAERLAGKVKFLKVNVDVCKGLSRQYAISSMPTVLVISKEGKVVDRKIGSEQIGTLLKTLEE